MRRLILVASLLASLVGRAFAQAPPPVPALPDTERRTSYLVEGTCACAVGFALYGDGTDYQNWVEVFFAGAMVQFNDPTFGWTITSPTGSLATIPRPITDAILTFNAPQMGNVEIVGARRPRRAAQFSENASVSARSYNQLFTDMVAQNREAWDKTSDVSGRMILTQPGQTLSLLPLPSDCANKFLGFDATGLNLVCYTVTAP